MKMPDRIVTEKLIAQIDFSSWIPQSLKVSPDSRRVAYAAQVRNKMFVVVDVQSLLRQHTNLQRAQGDNKIYVIVDEKKEKPYDDIGTTLIFSPDSRRVAYDAQLGNKRFVVVNGEEKKPYDEVGATLIFSPDSKRIAYTARVGNQWFVVVDEKEGQPYDAIGQSSLIFSPDSKRVAFAVEMKNKWFVIVDGWQKKQYDGIGSLIFTPDSEGVAYVAHLRNKQFVVVDGKKEGKQYDGILEGTPIFSPDSERMAYGARIGNKFFVVEDSKENKESKKSKERKPYDLIGLGSFIFSPDSKRVAFAAQLNNKQFFVVDGREKKHYDSIGGSLVFSPDSKRMAYPIIVGKSYMGNKACVVVDGKKENLYDSIIQGTLSFSPDSKRVAYAARVDNKAIVVVDGKEGNPYDDIIVAGEGKIIFDSPDSLHYLARKGTGIYLIEESLTYPAQYPSVNVVQELKNLLSDGSLVLFCGAGISNDFPTCLPLFSEYKNTIIDKMVKLTPRPKQNAMKEKEEDEYIDLLKNRPIPPELFMQQLYNHWGLEAIHLTDLFIDNKPNNDHEIISSLAKNGVRFILTTNFDRLIENRLIETGLDANVIEGQTAIQDLTEKIKSNNELLKTNTPIVIKLHGSAGNHKEIVITLNQVGKVMAHIRELLDLLLERYVFLFLGYSGSDLDIFPVILGSCEKAKAIYWTFHPNGYNETDIESKLIEAYHDKFHPIDADATKLLKELLPENEQQKLKNNHEAQDLEDKKDKKCVERIGKLIDEKIQPIDKLRVFSIFADLASYLNEKAAEEYFLKAAWQFNKKAGDKEGLAHTANDFRMLYGHLYAGNPSITLYMKINKWMRQSHKYAHRTGDYFIKGQIAASDGIFIYERKHDLQRAIKAFEKAKEYYNKLEINEPRQKDQLLGQTYTNMGHCYLNSCVDLQTQQLDLNKVEDAIKCLEDACKCFKDTGALDNRAEVYQLLGKCYNFKREFEKAEQFFKKALKIYEEIHDEFGQAQANMGLGVTFGYLNKSKERIDHLQKAKRLFQKINFLNGVQSCEALLYRAQQY
jgi:tetratricopeptide (TPR) repeat protein